MTYADAAMTYRMTYNDFNVTPWHMPWHIPFLFGYVVTMTYDMTYDKMTYQYDICIMTYNMTYISAGRIPHNLPRWHITWHPICHLICLSICHPDHMSCVYVMVHMSCVYVMLFFSLPMLHFLSPESGVSRYSESRNIYVLLVLCDELKDSSFT